ncbi:MAG TPA: anaerobic sulfatase maturase [Bryobacteraceae bacterium]|nr:anaerobic sulfatase maturase [Bryobacteraceae bacterium]
MNSKPRPFQLLVNPTSATFNLGGRLSMSDEVLEAYIQQFLDAHQSQDVTIAWHRGEPILMGLAFFQRSVEYAEKYRHRGQNILYTMRTDGTLLNAEWCSFFKENNFLIGLRLDGPKEGHDAHHGKKGSTPSFDDAVQGYELLRKHKVDVSIVCSIHAGNADEPLKVYFFFRDELQAQRIQFIPLVERNTEDFLPLADLGRRGGNRPVHMQRTSLVTERSVGAEQFGRFLIAIFDEWVRHDVGSVFVETFDAALGSWMGQHNLCIFSPTCGDALALEHNGDLYSCVHYVNPGYLLGNIQQTPMEELAASEMQRAFGHHKLTSLPNYCRECDVLFACYGECPRNRFITTPDGEPGLNYLCAGYKSFFRHIDSAMKLMAGMLNEAPSADGVIQLPSGGRRRQE